MSRIRAANGAAPRGRRRAGIQAVVARLVPWRQGVQKGTIGASEPESWSGALRGRDSRVSRGQGEPLGRGRTEETALAGIRIGSTPQRRSAKGAVRPATAAGNDDDPGMDCAILEHGDQDASSPSALLAR